MPRSQFVSLYVCVVLAACGQKFSATDGSAGAAGQGGGASGAAAAGTAGSRPEVGGAAGADSAGQGNDAGDDAGGVLNSAGVAGKSSGGSGGSGASGEAGRGGVGGAFGGAAGSAGRAGSAGSAGSMAGAGGSPGMPIPALGLALWLRADVGVQRQGEAVLQWLDQSGNHRDAIATATNTRPTYMATGLADHPTLAFDGVIDFLKLPDGFADFALGLTGFVVAKPTVQTCASMVELSNGQEIDDIALSVSDSQWSYEVLDNYFKGSNPFDVTKFSVYSVIQRVGGSVDVRSNGALVGSSEFKAPALIIRTNNFIGRSLYAECGYFGGELAEVILYQRALSDEDVLKVENYLQQHWAVPTATP